MKPRRQVPLRLEPRRDEPAPAHDGTCSNNPVDFHLIPTGQQIREAFALTPVGMSINALDGRYLYVNEALCTLTGYTAQELMSRDFMSITHPEDIERNTGLRRRLTSGEIPNYIIEKRYVRKNGDITWVRLSVSGIRDSAGCLSALFALMEDVTERKAAEEALRESEELYRRILETASEGICVVDGELRITYANGTLQRMLGCTLEDARGHTVFDFLDSPEKTDSHSTVELIKAGKLRRIRRRLRRKDGTVILACLSATIMRSPKGEFAGLLYMITDLSETDRVRRELDTTQERLRRAQVAAGVGLWEWDVQSNHVTAQESEARLFGVTLDRVGRGMEEWLRLIHPEDRARVSECLERAMEPDGPREVEFRTVWADGSVHWLLAKLHTTFDSAGKALLIAGVNIDITELKRANEALRQAQERLTVAQEAAGVGVWDWDIRSDVATCTDQHFRLYGRQPSEHGTLRSEEWAQRLHPDDRERVNRCVQAALSGSGRYEAEFRVIWPAGSIRWLLAKARVIFDSAGQPVRVVGCDIDVTERKRVEEALRASEERFRSAFAEAAIGIAIGDADGRLIVVNNAYCALTGYTKEELGTFDFLTITDPEDWARKVVLQNRLKSGEISSYIIEKRYIHRNGGRVWVRASVSAVRDSAGKLVNTIALTEDITAHVRAEEALRRSEERFRTAAEHATDLIVEVDLATCKVDLFGRWDELFRHGISHGGELARNWQSFIHPEDVERVTAVLEHSLTKAKPVYLECRAWRANGSVCHLAIRGTPLAESPGRFLLLLTDITERKAAEETASRLAAIVHCSDNAIISMDPDGTVQTWNKGAEELYGYSAEEMIGRSILNVCRPEGVQGALDRLAALRRGHFVQVEHDLRWRKDGSLVHVALRASPLRDGAGVLIGSASITEDISARMHAQEQLSESEERFRGVFERSPIGMALLAGDGSFLRVNSALCDLLGYSAQELANLRCSALSHVGDRQSDTNLHRQLVVGALPGYAIETRFIRKDGTLMWAKKTCSAIRSAAGEFLHAVVIVEDITQRRAAEDQLAFQAHHDALTGLPNRRLLEDRVQQAVAYARRNGGSFAVFYIDLDSFKLVNDSLGHVTGDVLLQDVAARLRNAVRESDTLARTGGDEFVLVATNLRGSHSAEMIAEKVRKALSRPFRIGGQDLFVTATIGISMYPRDGRDAQALQRNADSAMYDAKRTGKNSIRFFTPSMSAAALERLQLETQLRRALDNGEMSVFYQPQFRSCGRMLAGFEALLRWKSPSGMISPHKFIPIAEETGLIVPIGNWVLKEVCGQIVHRAESGRQPVRLAVNVSEVQFARPDFVRTVQQYIKEYGINPKLLELELTESIVMRDFEATAAKIMHLQHLGVGIAIDDFGTGYSSLSYLQRLPIDAVKLDRCFVREIGQEGGATPFLHALVALCRSLNMRVVVEGIETPRQLEVMRELGCDEVQGFFLGVPSPHCDFPPPPESN